MPSSNSITTNTGQILGLTFGLHSAKDSLSANLNKILVTHNVSNVLSWIPLVGTIVGIVRIIFSAKNMNYLKNELKGNPNITATDKEGYQFMIKSFKCEIARGIWELTSLGFVLALADIPITIARQKQKMLAFG